MMYRVTTTLLASMLLATAGLVRADDDFRCGGRIIKVGMTDTAVVQACGAPDSKKSEVQDVRSGNRVIGTTTVWRYTYTIGGRTRVLTFDQDKLTAID